MAGGKEHLSDHPGHGRNPKSRTIMRPIGPTSEYVLMQDDVGLWPTAALDCSEKWLARKGTRLVGMPHEVRGLPWLLVHSLEPNQWHHRETGREAGDADFDAGCWALMEGTALGLPGDLLRRVDPDPVELAQACQCHRSPTQSPTRRSFTRQTTAPARVESPVRKRSDEAGSDTSSVANAAAGGTKPIIPSAKGKIGASNEDEAGEISTVSTAASDGVSPGNSVQGEGSPRERFDSGKMCIGGDIEVSVHGKSGKQPLREALKTVVPRLQALWCTFTNDQETRLGAYKGHFNAIVFFLLGVQRAQFMKGAQKHVQMMFDVLARPKTGALEEMLAFSKSDNKDQGLALFRESMNDCIQELLVCLVNLTAFVDESARACALAALADVEASAAAVTYGLPKVPEEDQLTVKLSRIGSTNTRSITVSRQTDAGKLRHMLIECLGFPSSIRLLGPRDSDTDEDTGTLHPLPPTEMLVEGGAITVHGAITLHPGPSETDPHERTQAEFEWAFYGNVPRVTILQAIEMFQELRDGFAEEALQDKLERLHKAFSESKDIIASQKAMQGITELAYAVQSKVIEKYGYPSTPEGVKMMRNETADMYSRDERLHDLSRECQDLLSMKIAPTVADKIAKPPPSITLLKSSRFALQDVAHWKEHLNVHGFVVVADIISEEQRLKALDLLWDFLEGSDSHGAVDRDSHKTWQDYRASGCGWPARKEDGIINTCGIGQSSFLWYLRGLPQLKEVFASIWGTSSLVTSFDGANVFRPHGLDATWRPSRQHWYHVDQAHSKRGLHCVQGLVTLTPSSEERGGLVVVPGSHRFHNEVLRKYKAARGNYVQLKATDAIIREGGGPRLVGAEAGDLILWDSRTVHCNSAPLREDKCQSVPELLRAAAFVCMTPARWCSKATLDNRSSAVKKRSTCTHWPHELCEVDSPKDRLLSMPEVELSAWQKELVRPSVVPMSTSVKIGGLGERVITSGTPSLLPMCRFRVAQDKAHLVQAPFEHSATTRIGSIVRGQVVSGHIFGDWLRLDPISIWEVLRSSSPHAANQNEQEAWLKIAGGVAVRD